MTDTTASPLTLLNNALTIDLSNYATVSSSSGTYQPKITVTTTTASPLILSNNKLSIDLGNYYQISSKTLAERSYDGYKTTEVYLDNYHRVLSDQVNFYIQRVNPNPLITDWINIAQFGYNTATLKSSFFMNNVAVSYTHLTLPTNREV